MTKNSFVLRNSYADIFADMSDKQAGALIKVIFNYVTAKDVTEGLQDVEVKMAWKFIKQDIDYDTEKYNSLCAKRAEYGKQGGRPKADALEENPKKHKVFEKAKGFSQKHIDSDSDVVSVVDSDVVSDTNTNINVCDSKKRFSKPTVEEIRSYCLSRSNSIDAQAFYDFYESKGWKVGNTPMKNWQAAIGTWERRQKNEENNGKDYNAQPEPNKYAGFGRKITVS